VETGRDLWRVAERQLELLSQWLNPEGLFVDPGNIWIFVDWERTLHKGASIQGILALAWKKTADLALRLALEGEAKAIKTRLEDLISAGRKAYWNPQTETVTSGPEAQVSWASSAWMTLGGILSNEDGAKTLIATMADPTAVKPITPYLCHYVVEALHVAGRRDEGLALLESYWGAMVDVGADTFWEAFSPSEPLAAPYGDIHINSYCHAWSCTPSYFLR
jgi:alpha-L-rhamnosidase